MTDEFLTPAEAPEAPPFELPDAPEFRAPDPEPEPRLTAEDIRRIVREEREQAPAEYGDLITREDMSKVVGEELGRMRQEMQQERAMERAAVKFRDDLITEIGANLGEGGKAYLRSQLDDFDAQGLYGLTQNPKVKDTLFRAAAFEDVKAKTTKVAPRSEGTDTVTGALDANNEAELKVLWKGGFKTAFEEHGKTFDDFRKEMNRRTT